MVVRQFSQGVVLALAAVGVPVHAMGAEPTAQVWAQEIANSVEGAGGASSNHRIAIISGWEKKIQPILLEIDGDDFNSEGMLKVVTSDDVSLAYGINLFSGQNVPQWSPTQRNLGAALLTGSDFLILTPKIHSDPWKIFRHEEDGSNTDLKLPGPSGRSASEIKAWLNKILGYNAVVLAITGDFLLVGRLTEDFKGNPLQALAVKDSQQQFTIKESASKGLGILAYVNGKGPFAVFRKVFLEKGVEGVPIGTKLILETSH